MTHPLHFEHVERIDSTNSALMRSEFGAVPAPPRALLADHQEAGRGRNGRPWVTPPAASIALSVAVERPLDAASLLGLPLAVGVVVAECVTKEGAQVRLKWPNDVLVMQANQTLAKAGGILVEVRQQAGLQRVVMGVGLNLLSPPPLQTPRSSLPAGGLFESQAVPERLPLAHRLAEALAALVPAFAAQGLTPWLERWRALDAFRDAPIDLVSPDGQRDPVMARGVDERGALRVERPNGSLERVTSGEVSVRGR